MGAKSSCCNTQEPPLQTEIETYDGPERGYDGNDLYENDAKQSNQNAKAAFPLNDNEISLTRNDENDRIISKHIRQFSKDTNPNKSMVEGGRVKQLSEIVHYAPLLKLKVISSSTLPKGHTLTINAQGVEGSHRSQKDGTTYFGCKKRAKRVSKNVRQTEILNDYILPAVSPEISKKHRGRHFQIEYNVNSNAYKVKDLGVGFGTFYKLDFPLALKDNHLLNIGLLFIVVGLVYPEQRSDSKREDNLPTHETTKYNSPLLVLKFFGGSSNGEVQTLEPGERAVTLGRHADCDMRIDDNLLSKHQCSIEYTDVNGWVLKDGKDKRPSTNGTWLYIGEEQTVYNGMIFKANQTLFQASLL